MTTGPAAEQVASSGEPSRGALDTAIVWLTSKQLVWPLAIFLVAFGIRLAMVGYANPDPRDGRFDDSVFYDTSARALLDGRGYIFDPTVWVLPNGVQPDPDTYTSATALWPPAYPALLAVIYKLTGGSILAAKLVNVMLGALTAVLTYLIGRRLFGEGPGVVAGFAMALFPSHILFTSVIMSEVYYTFQLVLLTYLILLWVLDAERPRSVHLLLIGFLTGVAALIRGELILYPAALFLLFVIVRRSWSSSVLWTVLLGIGMAGALLPWTVRNCIQMDSCIVGTTGVGRALLQAHNPEADGTPSLLPGTAFEARFLDIRRPEREVVQSDESRKVALEWAREHPLQELGLVFRRFYFMYRDDEAGIEWVQSTRPTFGEKGAERVMIVSNAYYIAMVALALFGAPAWLARRRGRDFWAVLMPIIYYTALFSLVFVGYNRYHVPLLPFIAILAAVPLYILFELGYEQWRALRSSAPIGGSEGFGRPVEIVQPEDEAPPPLDAEAGRL